MSAWGQVKDVAKPFWNRSGMTWGNIVPTVERTLRDAGMPERADEWLDQAMDIWMGRAPLPVFRAGPPEPGMERYEAIHYLAYDFVRPVDGPAYVPDLRELREKRMLTQKELAEKAGVSRRTVGRIEKGGNANFRTLTALTKALDVASNELRVMS